MATESPITAAPTRVPAFDRRSFFALTIAAPILSSVPVSPTLGQSLTPFRIAEAKYRQAAAHLNALPDDLEHTNPAAHDRATDTFLDTVDAVDATPVSSWDEFADAYEIACDSGATLPNEDLIFKLLADVRRLRAGVA